MIATFEWALFKEKKASGVVDGIWGGVHSAGEAACARGVGGVCKKYYIFLIYRQSMFISGNEKEKVKDGGQNPNGGWCGGGQVLDSGVHPLNFFLLRQLRGWVVNWCGSDCTA